MQPDERQVRRLYRRLQCHPITAAVLANRGVDAPDAAEAFFNPSLRNIESLFALKDLETAVLRICRAISDREAILVFGDYDVDGITATTIIYQFLAQAGAKVDYHIPHRIEEGYGLCAEHITGIAARYGAGLIVTVDCGSASHDAVELASRSGIDVIITDHHDIDTLPHACAVVNPKRQDCFSGLDHLAGVGVAFALLMHLRARLREKDFWRDREEPNLKEACDLVALGTVADIVPLVHENRVLTRVGLEMLNAAPRPGIQALIEVCGIQKPALEAEDLAFRLGPRLNAAGRMDHARLAVELLTTGDPEEARRLAEHVNTLNSRRQSVESQILRRIEMYLEQCPEMLAQKSLVLSDPEWHQGVLGIVASRVTEKYGRPAVLFGASNGMWVGSARSLPGIDLYENISACADHLEAFGGHAMAAGLRLRHEQIEAFRTEFEAQICSNCPDSVFAARVDLDCEVSFDMISENLADELSRLEPFGEKNPEPLFFAQNVEVVFSKIIGEKHMRLMLRQPESKKKQTLPAVWFNIDPQRKLPRRLDRLAFRIRWNHYNGRKDIQLIVADAATHPEKPDS
ncbi:MAG: single-stranded-DNA-specific exonuclease RecJ [Desulfobacterales bacterium]|nr:single-stranded-DNA-specific exonuclease RecJ [Desulfobacterales bacterium]MBS3754952.1 single-stranded-DNA-specific exonuclease RecJ [Desulfobacterales bacterium]